MTIKIYSTPACTYCKMAKEFLTSQNVAYEDIDVSVDAAAREDMVEKSGQLGVPVFDIDGQIMVGYNQQLLSKVVGIGAASAAGADANNASN
jgi:glutaredoxin-like YruB-family protein